MNLDTDTYCHLSLCLSEAHFFNKTENKNVNKKCTISHAKTNLSPSGIHVLKKSHININVYVPMKCSNKKKQLENQNHVKVHACSIFHF